MTTPEAKHHLRLDNELKTILGCSCGWKPWSADFAEDEFVTHLSYLWISSQPPAPGLYRHYKGGLYCVIGLAKEEATLTPVVVYQSCNDMTLWTRPVAQFIETVNHEGNTVPRFQRIQRVA